MSVGVRDITNLEELLEIQDNDKIIVIQNGEAKLISKENAKFGGGGITTYWIDYDSQNSSGPYKLYHDLEFSNPVAPDEAEKAMCTGVVQIAFYNTKIIRTLAISGYYYYGAYAITDGTILAIAGRIREPS